MARHFLTTFAALYNQSQNQGHNITPMQGCEASAGAERVRQQAYLQQDNCQDVAGRAGHADDIGSQGVGGQLGNGAEGVDHVRLLGTGLQGRGHQGPLACQLPQQELHASRLIPLPAHPDCLASDTLCT